MVKKLFDAIVREDDILFEEQVDKIELIINDYHEKEEFIIKLKKKILELENQEIFNDTKKEPQEYAGGFTDVDEEIENIQRTFEIKMEMLMMEIEDKELAIWELQNTVNLQNTKVKENADDDEQPSEVELLQMELEDKLMTIMEMQLIIDGGGNSHTELEALSLQVDELQQQIDDKDATIIAVQEEKASAVDKKVQLEANMKSMESAFKVECEKLTGEKENLEKQIAEQKVKLADHSKITVANNELKEEIYMLKQSVAQFNGNADVIVDDSVVRELKEKLAGAEAEKEKLLADLVDQQENKYKATDTDELFNRVNELNNELYKEKQTKEVYLKEKEKLQKEVTALQSIVDTNADSADVNNELARCKELYAERVKESDDLQIKVRELNLEIEKFKNITTVDVKENVTQIDKNINFITISNGQPTGEIICIKELKNAAYMNSMLANIIEHFKIKNMHNQTHLLIILDDEEDKIKKIKYKKMELEYDELSCESSVLLTTAKNPSLKTLNFSEYEKVIVVDRYRTTENLAKINGDTFYLIDSDSDIVDFDLNPEYCQIINSLNNKNVKYRVEPSCYYDGVDRDVVAGETIPLLQRILE